MKKTYMNPSMDVVEIKAQQLLAGSINTLGGDYNGGGIQSRELEFEDIDDPSKWLLNNF